MKKRMPAVLATALACVLALSLMVPSVLAAEAEIPVPGSDMWLVSDKASTGTSLYTNNMGESYTLYLYPAGTLFSSTWLYSVSIHGDGSSNVIQYGGSFVLPESGVYSIMTMDAMTYTQNIYVTADGSGAATPEPEPEPVADEPSSWAVEQVNEAIEAGLVPESLQSQYTQTATRAEFCALAVELFETVKGEEITERATFNDTDDVNVEKMAALGVVNGTGDGNFTPEGALNREQAATMLARLAAAVGKPLAAAEPTFADSDSISDWAAGAVGQVQAAGIMDGTGNNTFSPAVEYSREQSILTILRLFEIVK